MKITAKLKAWLATHKGAAADISDEKAKAATTAALMDGSLDAGTFAELTKSPEAAQGTAIAETLGALQKATTGILDRLERLESAKVTAATEAKTETKAAAKAPTLPTEESENTGETGTKAPSMLERMFGGAGGDGGETYVTVNVKGAHTRYDTARKGLCYPTTDKRGGRHPYAGLPVMEGDKTGQRQLQEPSQLDQAINGAWLKMTLQGELGRRCPAKLRTTEHDRELVQYALRECSWAGVINGDGSEAEGSIGVKNRKLSDREIKAVLDDATSGGVEIAPIMFDDAIIATPQLFGEVFWRVNTQPITRGRRIEGGIIGQVTLSSGGADGTNIPLFSTSNFISAFDTNIYVANGAIELGLDFLSDSPIDVAATITAQYGQYLLVWLDTQVCTGDGTTEPEGVLNAGGTTSVASANGAAGPPTVGDYEGLMFGVAKPYRTGVPRERVAFVSNETAYQRARGIAVGASDERRVFGMDHGSFMLLDYDYAINESFTNRQRVFCNFARYRMYRRLGLVVRATVEGQTLVRQNKMMISARARFGGQLEDGGACAVTTDGQT